MPKELPIPQVHSQDSIRFGTVQCNPTSKQPKKKQQNLNPQDSTSTVGEAAARLAAAAKSPVTGMWLSARTLARPFCSTVVMVVQTRYGSE